MLCESRYGFVVVVVIERGVVFVLKRSNVDFSSSCKLAALFRWDFAIFNERVFHIFGKAFDVVGGLVCVEPAAPLLAVVFEFVV